MAVPRSRAELDKKAVNWAEPNSSHPTISGSFNRLQNSKFGLAPFSQQNHRPSNDEENLLVETEFKLKEEARAENRQRNSFANLSNAVTTTAQLKETAKVTPDTMWMLSIHMWFWVTIQLTLGVASLAFLGIAAGIESTRVGRALKAVADAANTVTTFFGLDFSVVSPTNLFVALHIILFGFIFLMLIATMFYFTMRGRSPVFGSGAGPKCTAILLSIIGSGMPVANLFPWLVIYVLIMWRYPK